MRTVIMQGHEGPQLQALMEYLQTFGVTRVVFPAREYRSKLAGNNGAKHHVRKSVYETARLLPRGEDGGLAESFLARDTPATHDL